MTTHGSGGSAWCPACGRTRGIEDWWTEGALEPLGRFRSREVTYRVANLSCGHEVSRRGDVIEILGVNA